MAPDPQTPLTKLRLGPPALISLRQAGCQTLGDVQVRGSDWAAALPGVGSVVLGKLFPSANPPEAPAASSVEPPGAGVSSGWSRLPFPGSLTEEERLLGELLNHAASGGPLSEQKALMVVHALRKALDEFRNPKADA